MDILVNNAGINRPSNFDQQTDADWQDILDVNLTGVFRACQECLPFIADGGRIINIGSLSGEYGGPKTPSHAAAKMGVMSLTHNPKERQLTALHAEQAHDLALVCSVATNHPLGEARYGVQLPFLG